MSNFVQTQIAQRALLVYWAKLLSLQVKVTIMEISRETKAAARPALWRAETLATNRAATAVVAALTPVCIDKFRQAADASANLAEMKKTTDSWDQSKFVKKGGWADAGKH